MMRFQSVVRRLLWLSLVAALVAVSLPALAARHSHKASQADTTVSGISGSTVAELHKLMAAKALTELRTTYNGTYGASLLFNASNLTYYAVLFHNKDFWRVIKTDQVKKAESVYSTFAAQSRQLAQVDIDTIRLQAGRKYAQHLLAEKNMRLKTLSQDLQRQNRQAQQIAQDQQQAKQEAVQLTQSLQSSNSQLEALRKHIDQLKARQANLHMQLPSPTKVPATTASTTSTTRAAASTSASDQ